MLPCPSVQRWPTILTWCFWKREKCHFRARMGRRAACMCQPGCWSAGRGRAILQDPESKFSAGWLICGLFLSPIAGLPREGGGSSHSSQHPQCPPPCPQECPALSGCSVDPTSKPGSGIRVPGRIPAYSLAVRSQQLRLSASASLFAQGAW